MQITAGSSHSVLGPKQQRPKRYSHNENVDEPGKLIDDEAVEIERELPAEESEPIDRSKENDKP
jgi:hypothetical protein